MHLLRWPLAPSHWSLVLGSRSSLLAMHGRLLGLGSHTYPTEKEASHRQNVRLLRGSNTMDLTELCSAYLDALSEAAASGDIVAANHLDVALGSFEAQLGQMRIALEKRREQPGYAAECAIQLRERPAGFGSTMSYTDNSKASRTLLATEPPKNRVIMFFRCDNPYDISSPSTLLGEVETDSSGLVIRDARVQDGFNAIDVIEGETVTRHVMLRQTSLSAIVQGDTLTIDSNPENDETPAALSGDGDRKSD